MTENRHTVVRMQISGPVNKWIAQLARGTYLSWSTCLCFQFTNFNWGHVDLFLRGYKFWEEFEKLL